MLELLLADDVPPYRIRNLANLKRLDDEVINGMTCYTIEGLDIDGNRMILFIQKENYLLRLIIGEESFDIYDSTSTMTFDPQISTSSSGSLGSEVVTETSSSETAESEEQRDQRILDRAKDIAKDTFNPFAGQDDLQKDIDELL